MVTLRSVLAIVVAKHRFIYQIDVHNAFLDEDLLEEVYMEVPSDFTNQAGKQMVCKLH